MLSLFKNYSCLLTLYLFWRYAVHLHVYQALIDSHKRNYGHRGWKFLAHDLMQDGLPDRYDLIHCRCMMQHIYNNDVMQLLYPLRYECFLTDCEPTIRSLASSLHSVIDHSQK